MCGYVHLFSSAGQMRQFLCKASLRGRLLKNQAVWTSVVRHKFTFRQKAIVGLCPAVVWEDVIHCSMNLRHSRSSYCQADSVRMCVTMCSDHACERVHRTTEGSLSQGTRVCLCGLGSSTMGTIPVPSHAAGWNQSCSEVDSRRQAGPGIPVGIWLQLMSTEKTSLRKRWGPHSLCSKCIS